MVSQAQDTSLVWKVQRFVCSGCGCCCVIGGEGPTASSFHRSCVGSTLIFTLLPAVPLHYAAVAQGLCRHFDLKRPVPSLEAADTVSFGCPHQRCWGPSSSLTSFLPLSLKRPKKRRCPRIIGRHSSVASAGEVASVLECLVGGAEPRKALKEK